MTFCRQCGKEVKANAKFCAACGTPLGRSTSAPVTPTQAQTSENFKSNPRSNLTIVVMGIGLLIAFIAVGSSILGLSPLSILAPNPTAPLSGTSPSEPAPTQVGATPNYDSDDPFAAQIDQSKGQDAARPNEAREQNLRDQSYNGPTLKPESPAANIAPTSIPVTRNSSWKGERFPETRTRYLSQANIQSWNYAKVRYALNEIYARHGYRFQSAPIRQQFQKFGWYRPVAGRDQSKIEQSLGSIEKANMLLLAQRRKEMQSLGLSHGE